MGWLVNNSGSTKIIANKTNNLKNLSRERTLKNVQNVNFGWREVRVAIIWLADAGLNFVTSVVDLTEDANAEDLILAKFMMMIMMDEDQFFKDN